MIIGIECFGSSVIVINRITGCDVLPELTAVPDIV